APAEPQRQDHRQQGVRARSLGGPFPLRGGLRACRQAFRPPSRPGTSQTRTVVSAPPDTSTSPPADQAREVTAPWCPRNRRRSFPVATSHSRIVPSSPPEASVLPPGDRAGYHSGGSPPSHRAA